MSHGNRLYSYLIVTFYPMLHLLREIHIPVFYVLLVGIDWIVVWK